MSKLSSFFQDYEPLDDFELSRANGESLPTNVYEEDGNVIVESHIAGLSPEHIDISVEGNHLFIEGSREENKQEKHRDYYIKEFRYGSFEKVVPLPTEVNLDKAQANYNNGVLTISLPKLNKKPRKKINISHSKVKSRSSASSSKKSKSAKSNRNSEKTKSSTKSNSSRSTKSATKKLASKSKVNSSSRASARR